MEASKVRKYIALGLILFLGVILFIALTPYWSALFGAIILFVLFNPLHTKLVKWKWKKSWSAMFVILLTLIVIFVPLTLLTSLLVSEATGIVQGKTNLEDSLASIDAMIPSYNLTASVNNAVAGLGDWITGALINAAQGVTTTILIMIIMYFLLYYMLINGPQLRNFVMEYIPFNKKNSERLLDEVKNVTNATVITSGVVAVIQGVLLAGAFAVLGINAPLFWGFIAAVLSFLPIVGSPLVWIPAAILLLFDARVGAAIGLTVVGSLITHVDYLIRPHLQKRMAQIHPLVTIVGVFMGLSFFGIIGIIIGPLIINYFLLLIRMFKEEYVSANQ